MGPHILHPGRGASCRKPFAPLNTRCLHPCRGAKYGGHRGSGGVAPLNHRLISPTPSESSIQTRVTGRVVCNDVASGRCHRRQHRQPRRSRVSTPSSSAPSRSRLGSISIAWPSVLEDAASGARRLASSDCINQPKRSPRLSTGSGALHAGGATPAGRALAARSGGWVGERDACRASARARLQHLRNR